MQHIDPWYARFDKQLAHNGGYVTGSSLSVGDLALAATSKNMNEVRVLMTMA